MNLGSPERPMVAEEPELDDILPAKDDSWDQGVSYPTGLVVTLPAHPIFAIPGYGNKSSTGSVISGNHSFGTLCKVNTGFAFAWKGIQPCS